MVNISRSTFQVCGMVSSKTNATHQAVNRYVQSAHIYKREREVLCTRCIELIE
jgi:hypothetical protein